MPKPETLSQAELYRDALVPFSPFAIQNTGLVQNQTTLKVDTYSLACVPYQFGLRRGVLAGSFSKEELAFFQRFKGSLAGLALAFQRPDAVEPIKIFCRCQIAAIGQMKGREGVGLLVCDWKPTPPDLEAILGDFLALRDRLQARAPELAGKTVQVSPENSRRLGYNNYAVMDAGGERHKLALFTIAADRLEFLMPMRSPDVASGTAVSFSLFFLKYRFQVPGRIESSQRMPTGVQKVRAAIETSIELVHILDEYFQSGR